MKCMLPHIPCESAEFLIVPGDVRKCSVVVVAVFWMCESFETCAVKAYEF